MTSTKFTIGLNDGGENGERMSSRVLRPPGGGGAHTDMFGNEPEPPPRGRRQVPSAGREDQWNGPSSDEAPHARPHLHHEQQRPDPTKPSQEPEVKSAAGNTSEDQNKNEPPKRVRVPPGGFSSGLW